MVFNTENNYSLDYNTIYHIILFSVLYYMIYSIISQIICQEYFENFLNDLDFSSQTDRVDIHLFYFLAGDLLKSFFIV